jgi:acyl-CoA synthetase (AMP-forming)/AMP-acid ligase II
MARDWPLRKVPTELVDRYLAEGWWTDQSLGVMVGERLATKASARLGFHSAVHPYSGTMGDVDRAARSFAASLRARGVGPGDVVVFQLPNWVEAAITFWGAAYAGAVVVPVVHFYGPKELDYIIRSTDPDVVITPDVFGKTEYLPAYEPLLSDRGKPWLVVGDPSTALPTGATPFTAELDTAPLAAPVEVDPDSLAIIAFTSGTTRDPKGVMHSHRTIGFESRQLAAMTDRGGPPPIVGAPVGHFMGMLGAFLTSLHRAHDVHLVDVWDPTQVLRLMMSEDITVAGGAPYFLTSLLDHPDFTDQHLAQMPFFGMGGATVPVAVAERATGLGITVFRSYGSTEHPSMSGSTLETPEEKRLHTDGLPMEGAEIRLDADGQILSRGPELCLGYTDPELTAQVFDPDGWYATGDVGVFDDDGYLTITDRISDVIIRGGENISAQEVEELLMGLDGVAEVAVVAAPDARLGEHAAAVVRLRDGARAPSLDDVRAHLAGAGLAKQKWPESIYEVVELPRTPSGKIQKFRLRQQIKDGELRS